jgi:hypothetical protein
MQAGLFDTGYDFLACPCRKSFIGAVVLGQTWGLSTTFGWRLTPLKMTELDS